MPKVKYCWDSGIFIAVLTGENRSPEEVGGLKEVIDLVDRQQVIIVTSSIVRTEVLDVAAPQVRQKLHQLFRRPHFVTVDVNSAISDKAATLREACLSIGRKLKTPDAIFLATAIFHRVDALHSFDDQLLNLSGLRQVDGLVISKPRGEQTILTFE